MTQNCILHLSILISNFVQLSYVYVSRDGLKPIGPIASNWPLRLRGPVMVLSALGCCTQNNRLQGCYGDPLGPTPPKAGPVCNIVPWCMYIILNVLSLAQLIRSGM